MPAAAAAAASCCWLSTCQIIHLCSGRGVPFYVLPATACCCRYVLNLTSGIVRLDGGREELYPPEFRCLIGQEISCQRRRDWLE
jgi:hypothetical protein